MSALERLGRGWAFPIVPDRTTGRVRYEQGPAKVRDSIWLILDTEPGERVMRPTFGCGLRQFLMQPNTVATRAVIEQEVSRSLTQWEPRIRLSDVVVAPGEDPSLVFVTIRYQLNRDGTSDQLIYPVSLGS